MDDAVITPPECRYCGRASKLVTGEVIYPHRPDLASLKFYQCQPCEAYVGTHKGSGKPLGFPVNAELRRARNLLHKRQLDKIWLDAWKDYDLNASKEEVAKFRRIARSRVYAYLAHQLGIDRKETHTAMFTLEQCREAWKALDGITYRTVRAWWKEHGQKKPTKAAA